MRAATTKSRTVGAVILLVLGLAVSATFTPAAGATTSGWSGCAVGKHWDSSRCADPCDTKDPEAATAAVSLFDTGGRHTDRCPNPCDIEDAEVASGAGGAGWCPNPCDTRDPDAATAAVSLLDSGGHHTDQCLDRCRGSDPELASGAGGAGRCPNPCDTRDPGAATASASRPGTDTDNTWSSDCPPPRLPEAPSALALPAVGGGVLALGAIVAVRRRHGRP